MKPAYIPIWLKVFMLALYTPPIIISGLWAFLGISIGFEGLFHSTDLGQYLVAIFVFMAPGIIGILAMISAIIGLLYINTLSSNFNRYNIILGIFIGLGILAGIIGATFISMLSDGLILFVLPTSIAFLAMAGYLLKRILHIGYKKD